MLFRFGKRFPSKLICFQAVPLDVVAELHDCEGLGKIRPGTRQSGALTTTRQQGRQSKSNGFNKEKDEKNK